MLLLSPPRPTTTTMPMASATRAVLIQLPSASSSQARYASTSSASTSSPDAGSSSSAAFPFPTHPRPTPHQIFHLAPGASQADVKARYYQLVRSHHPDSTHCAHITSTERHERFQAIGAAYDVLRGRRTSLYPSSYTDGLGRDYDAELRRRRRTGHGHTYREHRWDFDFPGPAGGRRGEGRAFSGFDVSDLRGGGPEAAAAAAPTAARDRWRDRALLALGVLALAAGLSPALTAPFKANDQRHRAAVANLREARAEAREVGHERRREIRKRVEEQRRRDAEADATGASAEA